MGCRVIQFQNPVSGTRDHAPVRRDDDRADGNLSTRGGSPGLVERRLHMVLEPHAAPLPARICRVKASECARERGAMDMEADLRKTTCKRRDFTTFGATALLCAA